MVQDFSAKVLWQYILVSVSLPGGVKVEKCFPGAYQSENIAYEISEFKDLSDDLRLIFYPMMITRIYLLAVLQGSLGRAFLYASFD